MQAYKANELASCLHFGCPKAPAALGDERLATVSHCVACCAIKGRGKKFHDFWISVQRGKWLAVRCEPLTQTEAFSIELN
jgi:hypothetical protein